MSHIDEGNGKGFPIVSTVFYKLHDPTSLEVEVLLLGDEELRKAALIYLTQPPYDKIWLQSDEPRFSSVEVLGIHQISNREYRVSFGASEVRIGLQHEVRDQETTWILKGELTPSGILEEVGIKHYSHSGDIKFEPLAKN